MKNSNANIYARQQQIISLIKEQEGSSIDTTTLAKLLNVSPITIRRDIGHMQKDGLQISRSGGIVRLSGASGIKEDQPAVPDHLPQSEKTKRRLAEYVSDLIDDGDVILMNSSKLVSYCIEYIRKQNVTVVTNNILMLTRNIAPGVQLVITGGQYHPGQTSLTGGMTTDQISAIGGTKCIIGVSGISASGGITSPYVDESYVNKKMIEQTTGPVIIAAEGYKIGRKDRFKVSEINEKVSLLITDSSAPQEEIDALKEKGLKVVIVPLTEEAEK